MLPHIKYFQAVAKYNSFSEAAEECHISQSAISQQVKALENELGFLLLKRKNRKFELTEAGEFFYKKSLVLINDYERICAQAAQIARQGGQVLRLGYLAAYGGGEFYRALAEFAQSYPDIEVKITGGTHEKLFQLLRTGEADLVFSDQRRAFSAEYANFVLAVKPCFIEIATRSPLVALDKVSLDDLKNTPCILAAAGAEQEAEAAYWHEVIGVQGEFIFAAGAEEADMLLITGRGYKICTEAASAGKQDMRRIPLMRGDEAVTQTLCAFWKKNNANFTHEFAGILKGCF